MTETERVQLDTPRALGALISDALRIYRRHFGTFLVIGVGVIAPTEAIVSGVGLGEFGSDSTPNLPLAAQLVPGVVHLLVTTPLITAMAVYALLDLTAGDAPAPRRVFQRGLDAFRAVFVPVLMALAAEALAVLVLVLPLAVAVNSPLVPTLVVPFVLVVRLFVVPQAVVAGEARGAGALRASWELTRGSAWRVAGIVLLLNIGGGYASALVGVPVDAIARAANSGALLVLGSVVGQSVVTPALALIAALLYFDLRRR